MERVIRQHLKNLRWNTQGQDVAEYAIMLAVVLVIVIGVVRMIGSNANIVFSQVGSAIQ
jgi:Flp pilus assembly pilin Flp